MRIVTLIRAIQGLRRFGVSWVTIIVIPQAALTA